jgi:hypothetical protein
MLPVVRDPAKLESLLLVAGLTQETLAQHVKIFPGNALDEKAIKWTLRDDSGAFASLIVFGIGEPCPARHRRVNLQD